MRYLILSDIHANLQALDAVLTDAAAVGYDATICLGDLVGYGGDPGAVIERLVALNPVALVRGNHDKVCAGLEPPSFFNEVARQAIEWTRATLGGDHLALLAGLPKGPQQTAPGLEICHGAPFDEDYYIFDETDAARALRVVSGLCLFGHTHVPAMFTTGTHAPARASDPEWRPLPDGPTLVNVGAVGQPRDGDPRAAYAVLDWTHRTIRLRRVIYDIKGAQRRIISAGLPMGLAVRLERGQ